MFKEQINSFPNRDIRTLFGYSLDVICAGKQPEYENIHKLFNNVWNKATDELKSNMGLRLHNYMINPNLDENSDPKAKDLLYDSILNAGGIKYIPDQARAIIYRKLARNLAIAKDTSYGWNLENSASQALVEVGVFVPSIAIEEVYQEILSVWCGNYWGRSDAHRLLHDFIFGVDNKTQVTVAKLFIHNERVKSELWQSKPNKYALELLNEIKDNLKNKSQISEIDSIITQVMSY